MKRFNIKEDDVINIDKYINERPKIKKEISEIKKTQHWLLYSKYVVFLCKLMIYHHCPTVGPQLATGRK